MILSNQAECLRCGDKPFSANRHDFKSCTCGAISVDGGMAYLRRVGDLSAGRDMSIEIDDAAARAAIEAIDTVLASPEEAGQPLPERLVLAACGALVDHGIHLSKLVNNYSQVASYVGEGFEQAQEAAQWALDTKRNALGILSAIARAYRDHGGVMFEPACG